MRNFISSILGIFLLVTSSMEGFEGFYVGGSTGLGAAFGRQSGSVVGDFDGIRDSINQNQDFFHGMWEGVLFGGYGWRKCCFIGGLEGFASFGKHDFVIQRFGSTIVVTGGVLAQSEALNAKTRVEIGPRFGFDFRPGFLVDPITLLYARIGVEFARVDLKSEARYSGRGGGSFGMFWAHPLKETGVGIYV